MKGMLEKIEKIEAVKTGHKKNGDPWTLWATKITVDNKLIGISSFQKGEVIQIIESLKVGSKIELEIEEKGNFANLVPGTKIKIISEGSGPQGVTPVVIMDDKEITKLWTQTADEVTDYLKGKGYNLATCFATPGAWEEIGPSVNTLFMKKMEERRRK